MFQNHEYSGYGDEPRRKREDNNKPNHVLLFTIINPVYPITVVQIYIILNDLFSDITFDSVESATRAKEALHGCDIYSGCCTLKIDFAKRWREYFWSLFYHQYFANAAIATDAILVLVSSQLGLMLHQPLYYFYFQLIASYPPQASSIPRSGILPYCVIPDMHQHSFIAISRLQPISL
ncbi:hypothetical protein G9C98_003491 [Cotesia typhae]|uniref:Uncharacterized protein n=1 Tax=Cotesia typhae TaxID=2053667 RepID=A0A8J5VB81_9HYME|nr:hypothetical protein G9C98_003491 [Cotesia typhae]